MSTFPPSHISKPSQRSLEELNAKSTDELLSLMLENTQDIAYAVMYIHIANQQKEKVLEVLKNRFGQEDLV